MRPGSGGPSLSDWGERLRGPWRILAFAALFVALAWALGSVLPVPAGLVGQLVWQGVVVLVAAVGGGAALLHWVDGRPVASLGFAPGRGVGREVLAGLAIGAMGMVTILVIGLVAGGYALVPDEGSAFEYLATLLAGATVLALPAAAEEALFRGYPFQALAEWTGPVAATVVFSLAFAVVHAWNPEVVWFALANIFLAGVMLSLAYLRTGSLWFASAVHLGWNWAVALPLDLPVSGLHVFDAPLYDTVDAGPTWLTGGSFGPEGGVLGTVGIGLATGLVWWWTRREAARRES